MTLINKESLLLVMNTLSENADPSVLDWEFAVDVVRTAPEADPVRHGHWIHNERESWMLKCPFCKSYFLVDWNFCPNCGAKMDGDKNDVD